MEQQQAVTRMRVGNILPGNNPRGYFDPAEMTELEESVRVHEVIQPILIRPVEGGFALVAGERRVRAAIKVLGADYEIPVHVKEMTADEAEELALIENVQRANMSPTEEAESAAKVLGRCDNNRDEAANRLGWSRITLDKRLALMNCSPAVRKALDERKIPLGLAELLAAVPKEKQDSVLDKILAMPVLPTVAQLKAQLESISKSMAAAIFDLAQCTNCHHNSGNQQVLFSECIQTGHCTDGACFDKKTAAILEAKKLLLEEDYPCVKIVQPGENFTIIKLVIEGATGVGAEQAQACRACKDFGAVISNVPGKIGNVYKEMCFDSGCNTNKVGARIKAEKEAAQPAAKTVAVTKPGASKAAEKSKTVTTSAAATKVHEGPKVVEYRTKIWRAALKKELSADQRENLSLLIAIMMTRGGSNVSQTKLSGAFEKMTGSKPSMSKVGEAAGFVSRADDATRNHMLMGIVMTITDSIEQSVLPDMLSFMQVDLAKHWKLNSEFLTLLTKSEIEVIAEEIGLKAALGEKYAKVINGKKDDLVKGMLAVEGFDYTGKIPSVLKYAA